MSLITFDFKMYQRCQCLSDFSQQTEFTVKDSRDLGRYYNASIIVFRYIPFNGQRYHG